MRWINVDTVIHAQIYDEEHEECLLEKMTVEDFLDAYTDEGCPTITLTERNDSIWEALSKIYNMDGVPDKAKAIIGDVMLGLNEPSA